MFKDVHYKYDFDEMMQLLIENDSIFDYCYQYYIEDVESCEFVEGFLRPKMAQGFTEREAIAEYIVSWIPWEEYPEQIMEHIRALENT